MIKQFVFFFFHYYLSIYYWNQRWATKKRPSKRKDNGRSCIWYSSSLLLFCSSAFFYCSIGIPFLLIFSTKRTLPSSPILVLISIPFMRIAFLGGMKSKLCLFHSVLLASFITLLSSSSSDTTASLQEVYCLETPF